MSELLEKQEESAFLAYSYMYVHYIIFYQVITFKVKVKAIRDLQRKLN